VIKSPPSGGDFWFYNRHHEKEMFWYGFNCFGWRGDVYFWRGTLILQDMRLNGTFF
jgi:hypothetical protein